MKLKYQVMIAAFICSLAACGEKKAAPENTGRAAADTAQPADRNTIALTMEQMRAVGIETGHIAQKNLTSVVKASGQLAVPPQNKADVNVLYGGIIRKIAVLEGQEVRKGQALALLENTDLIRLQQDYLAARRGFSYIAQEYQRQQALRAADAGTGKSYQSAEANYKAEQARLSGMEEQLRQGGIDPVRVAGGHITRQVSVTAPISGTVGHIGINTGSFAQPGTALMQIVDNSQIHADLTVYEKDLLKVHDGQQVRMVLTNQESQEIYGQVYGLNKSFEDETKGIVVHARVSANKYGLIPGMYVTALIDVGRQYGAAVPVDAIVRSEGKSFVFIQTAADSDGLTFKKAEIVPGVTELGYTRITAVDELPADAVIITKGAYYAQSKAEAGAEEE